jgi:excisionase family DNA binding protein
MDKKLYTVSEVAELLRLNKRSIYRLFQKGELAFLKIGGSRRVTEKQIDEYYDRVAQNEPEYEQKRECTEISDSLINLMAQGPHLEFLILMEIATMYADDFGRVPMSKEKLIEKMTSRPRYDSKEQISEKIDLLLTGLIPDSDKTWLKEENGKLVLGDWGRWYRVPPEESEENCND